MPYLEPTTNVFGFIKEARKQYLEYLNAGGEDVEFSRQPHKSSNTIAVYDSSLGMCAKKAALERNGVAPTHPDLAELTLNDLHRMRSGVVAESEWISTLRFIQNGQEAWDVHPAQPVHGTTRGVIDAWISLRPHSFVTIAEQEYENVAVEFKRTDADLKDSYIFQLCSYLYKVNDFTLGKLILDHRHTIKEYTIVPYYGDVAVSGWIVYDEEGKSVKTLKVEDLVAEITEHSIWMRNIADAANRELVLDWLPKSIPSPLDSWQCHQNWRKREGKASFRCPFAGYCFGIKASEFDVVNEKEGRKIAARLITADDGTVFRHEEAPGDE